LAKPKLTTEIENNALFDQLNAKQKLAVTKLENLLILERKAYPTIKGYRNILINFLWYYKDTLPSLVTAEQIKDYILMRIKDDTIAKSTHNQLISTLKAFYGRLLLQFAKVDDLYRPTKEESLPKGLSPDEIKRLFAKVGNLKHRSILTLLYGSGLRVGEVVRLKWEDLDFEEKTVFVNKGKHYKDRYTILSDASIAALKKYSSEHNPTDWIFESPDFGHYSERSVQQFFTDAMKKAQIKKPLNSHSLRHAFATQLLKSHEDLDFVRKVMGHASIKTTQIYLHVLKEELTKTKSPMDDLDI
jgi:integrase/recombinase XerD